MLTIAYGAAFIGFDELNVALASHRARPPLAVSLRGAAHGAYIRRLNIIKYEILSFLSPLGNRRADEPSSRYASARPTATLSDD